MMILIVLTAITLASGWISGTTPNITPTVHVKALDGCSVPYVLVSVAGVNKDNPAMGQFTAFSRKNASGACDKHDVCYDTLDNSKQTCDQAFLDNMMSVCDTNKCEAYATMYYLGVKLFGDTAFVSAQSMAVGGLVHRRRSLLKSFLLKNRLS